MSFFKEYISNLASIGAITPSSRFLSAKMTSVINADRPLRILEVGAGTGVFTKNIVKNSHPDSDIFVSELNPFFCNMLDKAFKDDITLIRGDILDFNPDTPFDIIICSIPFNSLPIEITESILSHLENILKENCPFVFFEYSVFPYLNPKNKFKHYKKLNLLPYQIQKDFTLLNFPPATIHHINLKK